MKKIIFIHCIIMNNKKLLDLTVFQYSGTASRWRNKPCLVTKGSMVQNITSSGQSLDTWEKKTDEPLSLSYRGKKWCTQTYTQIQTHTHTHMQIQTCSHTHAHRKEQSQHVLHFVCLVLFFSLIMHKLTVVYVPLLMSANCRDHTSSSISDSHGLTLVCYTYANLCC